MSAMHDRRWLVALLVIFAALAVAIAYGVTPGFDAALLNNLAMRQSDAGDRAFGLLTPLGSLRVLVPMAILVIAIVLLRRHVRDAVFFALAFGGASLANTFIKLLVARPRPHEFDALVAAGGYAFPSGHVTQIAAFAFALYLLAARTGAVWRWPAGLLLMGLVAVVATSRIYLQVHYPTDVIGSLLFAGFWVLAARHAANRLFD